MATDDQSYFAEVAESYDRLQPVLSPPYDPGLRMLTDLVPFAEDASFQFVDLGCGTAEPALRVLDRFPNATGTCVDNEPEMLSLAAAKLSAYSARATFQAGDIASCAIPECDLVFSAKAFHHVPPEILPALLQRIRTALRPGGCFILFDSMSLGSPWGERMRGLAAGFRVRHRDRAVASGEATAQELDARMEYKRKMKAAGKDVEYQHAAEDLVGEMKEAGFAETAIAWRMLADAIVLGLV